ncbi:MAG: M20/M25/M40 family metallo-hydrolase [Eubacterium sp.]|nr:M20/M25/M40 family metallo-hydrolase [Eubacterium sp.]
MPQVIPLERAVSNLCTALQFKTIAAPAGKSQSYAPFDDFILFLARAYPLCHQRLEHTRINNYGLVYRFKGKNREAAPLLFLAHYDLLHPASHQDELWAYPPFEGKTAGGFIYGRGALSAKAQLIALLETLEALLASDQQPERDVYLAFGFDAAEGGGLGAARIASFFKSQRLHFECILDGGSACIDGLLPQLKRPVALVGTCEKGLADLRLTLSQGEGSTAISSADNAIYALARVLSALQASPMPARFTPPVREFFKRVAPDITGSKRRLYDHFELFKPSLTKALSAHPLTNALIRTTIAPTLLTGSPAAQFFPNQASVVLRCHLLSADSIEDVIAHIQKTASKEPISFDVLNLQKAPRPSATDTLAYRHLAACASVVFPQVQTAPTITAVPTDARHYEALSEHIYRFTPIRLTPEDLDSLWGINEKISFENLHNAIAFYTMFILNYQ